MNFLEAQIKGGEEESSNTPSTVTLRSQRKETIVTLSKGSSPAASEKAGKNFDLTHLTPYSGTATLPNIYGWC